jgi:hypothetical protein
MSATDYTGRILLRTMHARAAKPMPSIGAKASFPGSFGNKDGVDLFAAT